MDQLIKSILNKRRIRAIDYLEKVNGEDNEYVHVFEVDDYGECTKAKRFKLPVGETLYFIGTTTAASIQRIYPTVFLSSFFKFYSGPCFVEHGLKWIDEEDGFDTSIHHLKRMTVEERHLNAFSAADLIKSFGSQHLVSSEDFKLLTQRLISERFFISSFKTD